MLSSSCDMLNKRCIEGITANVSRCREHVHNSIGTVTALVPLIGYANASSVAKQALKENKTISDIILKIYIRFIHLRLKIPKRDGSSLILSVKNLFYFSLKNGFANISFTF